MIKNLCGAKHACFPKDILRDLNLFVSYLSRLICNWLVGIKCDDTCIQLDKAHRSLLGPFLLEGGTKMSCHSGLLQFFKFSYALKKISTQEQGKNKTRVIKRRRYSGNSMNCCFYITL